MIKKYLSPASLLTVTFFLASCITSAPKNNFVRTQEERPDSHTAQARGKQFAISTHGKYATLAAEKMYDLGGNIIDASIAASFVISVERPQSTGIGGGGFLLFFEGKTGKTYAVDFRERAPLKAHKNMYLDKQGQVIPQKSRKGILAVGVPGLVAGLLEVHDRFGTLPLATILQPAIDLAENGFALYPDFHKALERNQEFLQQDPAARKIFLTPDGSVPAIGTQLYQKDLAKTLRLIAKNGKKGFYSGPVAKSLTDFSTKTGGLITQKDLDSYRVHWREPLKAEIADYTAYSMPPPSSGGVHVIQFLKTLHNDALLQSGPLSAPAIHLAAGSLQNSFADRAKYMGDPDFVKVPVQELLNSEYLKKRRSEIPSNRARKANEVSAGKLLPPESLETTHFSIMDQAGNAVASTQTINGWMGAAVVPPGTGIVLNNEMDDFAAKETAQNIFGAVGGEPNFVEPQKTPLSSMSPVLLIKNGKPFLSVGAPGGTRIISCVAQTILNYTEFKMSLYDAVSAIRYHHQWQPDVLYIDPPGPTASVLKSLNQMGYDVKIQPTGCKVMAVAREQDDFIAVSDPRDIGESRAK